MAYDEGLAQRLRDYFDSQGIGVVEKKMFGGLAFMLDGNMCVGVLGETLMARVGKDRHDAALERPHARPMDFTGRPMKGFLYVDPAGYEADEALVGWVELCMAFVRTLPPK